MAALNNTNSVLPNLTYKGYQRQQRGGLRAARQGVAGAKQAQLTAGKVPQSILDLKNLMASLPTNASIGQAYDTSLAGTGAELAALNTGKAGADVSAITALMGQGIGADAGITGEAARSANTSTPSSDANMLAAVGAQFGQSKVANMKDLMTQKMGLTTNLMSAEDAFAQNKSSAADRVTQARMALSQATPDPLSMATNWMAYSTNRDKFNAANADIVSSSSNNSNAPTGAKADGKPVIVSGQPRTAPSGKQWIWKNGKETLVKKG